MSRPHLVFVHGWGFGPGFWNPLRAELAGYSSTSLDLGFFGPENLEADLDVDSPRGPLVAVGHSLGVPWLLRYPSLGFDALVSLGGFARFDVPPGPTRAMRRGLGKNASAVLAAFHQACGLPSGLAPDLATARLDRLALGLDWLLAWDETDTLEALGKPILALAAEDDAVAPPRLSRASFPHGLIMLSGGGHSFPMTRAGECARHIAAFLETL